MGADKHERSRKEKPPRYLRLFHWMLNSAAWRSLSPVAQAVYIQIAARYMGSNNGRIPFSVREGAAHLGVSKSTVHRALVELVDRGFIFPAKRGAFSLKLKHATEWRLAEHACDVTLQPATKEFMRWQPEEKNSVPSMGLTVPPAGPCGPTSGTVVAEISRNVPTHGTVNDQKSHSRSHQRDTSNIPDTPCSGASEARPQGAVASERRRAVR